MNAKQSFGVSGLRHSILFSALALAMSGAYAAEPVKEEDAKKKTEEKAERIEVTGSRISRTDIEPTQPMTVVDSEYLSTRGLTNAFQAVTSVPGIAAGQSPTFAGNQAAGGQGVGQSTVDIFGLGAQRTLTLVNGSRFVSSNSPTGGGAPGSQVDVNNIPVGLVERVEIVKVGGAAVYGSDAVAGVINYVLKRDYEGLEFSYDNKQFAEIDGNAPQHSARMLVGGNFANDRGNVVLSLEYNETTPINAIEVPSRRNAFTWQTPAAADRVALPDGTFFSGQNRLYPDPRVGVASVGGLITPGNLALTNLGIGGWSGKFYQFDPRGSGGVVDYDRGRVTGNAVWASGGHGLDLLTTNTAFEGYKRFNVTTLANYNFSDSLRLSVSVFSNSSDAVNPGHQTRYSAGAFNGTNNGSLKFGLDHPYLTAASRQQLAALPGNDGTFWIHKSWLSIGQTARVNESQLNSYKFALEGDVDLGQRLWTWTVSGQTGVSSVFSNTLGVNDARWFAAMDVGINPATNQIDCKYNYEKDYGKNLRPGGFGVSGENPLGTAGNCRPFNPFGTPTQASLDYFTYATLGKSRNEQDIASAYASGDVASLPAGSLDVAFGIEQRREYASFVSDGSLELQGLIDTSVKGAYTSQDMFAEVHAPLLAPEMDIPGLYSLSLESSFRTMDNSRSGKDDAWAVGLNYRPIKDLMIRGNISQTVRAPAVTELFSSRGESAQFATDPCDNRNISRGPRPDVRKANCAKDGVPADFLSLAQNATRRGFAGGNPNLKNEVADTINYGIVYAPSWVEGLELSVDYVNIEIEDAILTFTLTDLMTACYDAPDFPNKFCGQFKRINAPGTSDHKQLPSREAFESGFLNAALRRFEAIEYAARYKLPTEFGDFVFSTRFYNLKENATSNTGVDFTDVTGQFNSPEWRGDFTVVHSLGDWTTLLDVRYWGEGRRDALSKQPYQYVGLDGQVVTDVPAFYTADLAVNYALNSSTTLRARIENLADWYPSPVEQSLQRYTFGRVYNLGLTTRF